MIEPKPKEKGYNMDEKYAGGISCMRQKIREYYEKTYLGMSTSARDGIFGHQQCKLCAFDGTEYSNVTVKLRSAPVST